MRCTNLGINREPLDGKVSECRLLLLRVFRYNETGRPYGMTLTNDPNKLDSESVLSIAFGKRVGVSHNAMVDGFGSLQPR